MDKKPIQNMAYNDLWLILQNADESASSLLPGKLLDFIQSSMVPDAKSEIDLSIPLYKQKLSGKTRGWLAALNLTYWAEDETDRRKLAQSLFRNEQLHNGNPEAFMSEADYQDILKEYDHWNEMFGPIPFWEESRGPKAYFDPEPSETGAHREPAFLYRDAPEDAGEEFWTLCPEAEGAIVLNDEPLQEKRFKKYGHIFETGKEAAALYARKQRYDDKAAGMIMLEAEKWEIYVEETEGYDMGYGTEGEDTSSRTKPVPPEIILVADGHFAGVADTSGVDPDAQPEKDRPFVHAALIKYWNGQPMFYAGSSESFSSDDHESWSSTSYYLQKKTV